MLRAASHFRLLLVAALLALLGLLGPSGATQARENAPLASLPPVSYTHLDVYKRQFQY